MDFKFPNCTVTFYTLCCCDRKCRAACAQSFATWQQATIEITRRDQSIIACSRHIHIFLFFAHIPFVVNHTINATPPERLQQYVAWTITLKQSFVVKFSVLSPSVALLCYMTTLIRKHISINCILFGNNKHHFIN